MSRGPGNPVETLQSSMRQVLQLGASDLHLKSGAPPYARLNGELTPLPGMYAISLDEMEQIVRELCSNAPLRLQEFEKSGEADLAYAIRGAGRFRINIFRQRGEISVAARAIREDVPHLDDLNLPPVLEQLSQVPRGLILLTGATGSGKTTSLAGMVNYINENYSRHVVTIEDPIEIVHRDIKSLINQREVGLDTGSFGQALRRALRQDPDVILVGEMRDEETVRTALSAAETGHLVFSTLHTIDVMESIYRILDFFPPELERQARNMLAGTLKGVVSQRLVRTKDGRSRVPAVEVLVGTSRISDCILKPEETGGIHDAIAEGGYYGMQSFDQSLMQLVVDDVISVDEAMFHASSKQNFALLLEANSVNIDRDLRRRASGSMNSIQDDIHYESAAKAPAPPPPPMAPAAPGPVSAAPVHNPPSQSGYGYPPSHQPPGYLDPTTGMPMVAPQLYTPDGAHVPGSGFMPQQGFGHEGAA